MFEAFLKAAMVTMGILTGATVFCVAGLLFLEGVGFAVRVVEEMIYKAKRG